MVLLGSAMRSGRSLGFACAKSAGAHSSTAAARTAATRPRAIRPCRLAPSFTGARAGSRLTEPLPAVLTERVLRRCFRFAAGAFIDRRGRQCRRRAARLLGGGFGALGGDQGALPGLFGFGFGLIELALEHALRLGCVDAFGNSQVNEIDAHQ